MKQENGSSNSHILAIFHGPGSSARFHRPTCFTPTETCDASGAASVTKKYAESPRDTCDRVRGISGPVDHGVPRMSTLFSHMVTHGLHMTMFHQQTEYSTRINSPLCLVRYPIRNCAVCEP
jgi:hypothetical protein